MDFVGRSPILGDCLWKSRKTQIGQRPGLIVATHRVLTLEDQDQPDLSSTNQRAGPQRLLPFAAWSSPQGVFHLAVI